MISEQVNLLRDAVIRLRALDLPNTANEVKEAADTIEELSAKLANANMERSTAYYNDGWIPCSERLPEFEIYSVKKLWVTMHRKECYFRFVRQLRWNGCQGVWEWENGKTISDEWEIIAWKPLYIPEPYKGE
jgi:hypothetical protein